MKVEQGCIAITAGWRAHCGVDVIGDYFDGTLKAKLGIEAKKREFSAVLSDVEVLWQGGLPIIGGVLERKLEGIVTEMGNKAIMEMLLPLIKAKIDKYPQQLQSLSPIRENVFLELQPANLVKQLFTQPSIAVPLPKFEYKPLTSGTGATRTLMAIVTFEDIADASLAFYRLLGDVRVCTVIVSPQSIRFKAKCQHG